MGRRGYELLGFESFRTYGNALAAIPRNRGRFLAKQSAAMQLEMRQEGGGELKRVLNAWDLMFMGVGMMLGAGVFVTTGYVAANMAGPAVVLSYALAGVSALLSSLCYAEFASSMPLAGGAYCYVAAVFGEYLAWITVANLILEYMLANAAAIRGFAPYFSMLVNQPATRFVTPWTSPAGTSYNLDWFAFAWVVFLSVLLVLGTKESATFNTVMTLAHLALVGFIIVAGLTKAKPANAQPFFPFEVRGLINGAAMVYFAFIGFDAVACSAEEVKRPAVDLPLGILGALGIVTVCYILMAATLVLMVPLGSLDLGAPFAAAFSFVGMDWARYIVALGALMGIVTTTLVGLYATARIIAAVARAHMLPPVLARVHARLGTPWVATVLSGAATAVMALFTDFGDLVDMVSISTLFAFLVVALALLWNRFFRTGVSPRADNIKAAAHMGMLMAACAAFTLCYQLAQHSWVSLVVCGAVGIATVVSMHLTCVQHNPPSTYGVPLFPYVPALSAGLNCFLLGQLKAAAYERFAVWSAFVTVFYLLYSLPAAAHKEERSSANLPQVSLAASKDVGAAEGEGSLSAAPCQHTTSSGSSGHVQLTAAHSKEVAL